MFTMRVHFTPSVSPRSPRQFTTYLVFHHVHRDCSLHTLCFTILTTTAHYTPCVSPCSPRPLTTQLEFHNVHHQSSLHTLCFTTFTTKAHYTPSVSPCSPRQLTPLPSTLMQAVCALESRLIGVRIHYIHQGRHFILWLSSADRYTRKETTGKLYTCCQRLMKYH